ncbi:MAG: 16S rRNA (cytosine(1402)-N(4))-methyltransferase RsmH [Planctomycetota bacterium]|nr:16S rRNA (cytosine(1402)-N(4))-methyltransferase RsmH [Planctomycetota bacterium]
MWTEGIGSDLRKGAVHQPVMVDEVLFYLNLKDSRLVVDGTCGEGGHTEEILKNSPVHSIVLAMDRDPEILEVAKKRLSGEKRVVFVNENYRNLADVLKSLHLGKADAIFLDLGMSSYHLKEVERGFSFDSFSLDMRYDRREGISAEEFIHKASKEEMARVFWKYGEERRASYIAALLVAERRKRRIASGRDLASLIEQRVGRRERIHPATRVFQALRIFVNNELEHLERFLETLPEVLTRKGRFVSLSFHSLEDRLVKQSLKRYEKEGLLRILTKKVVRPSKEEVCLNPNSRSARLRAAEARE